MNLFYNRSNDLIEIVERDATNQKTGSWKFNVADKKLANKILSHLIQKYGFKPEITPEESVNSKKKDWIDINVKL